MDPQTYMDVATVVTKLKMYPYFDIAHYTLMCIAVREDVLPQQGSSTPSVPFSRKHPLSSWLSSMLICFAGSIIANMLLGEPLITPFKDHQSILTATAVWYLVNYSPFDLVYKLAKFLPVKLAICVLKETQRAHKVYHGVLVAAKLYPSSYLVIIMVGTLKGAGSGLMKNFDRLIRGIWIPGNNEILQPSFATKASLVASIVFLCERLNLIAVPHPLIYFGIVLFFVYFKISSVVLGIHDPFVPLENLFCAIFCGGMWDALRRAASKEPTKEEENKDPRNDVIKSKDEKKKD
ncbi:trimeric intracellular cation channel type 1B.1 [Aplysia californica]|uniref:Trimeric intracellular cation channel type 1B.1 n=1 Tax=Aplysia californica TaxID=6500 RepID=A0ABM0JVH6_APLCA|nr:trimeric intracellular cation channel type 1B.1 [Aplysia californica]